MNQIAATIDIWAHLWIPPTGAVSEVNTSFKHLLNVNLQHQIILCRYPAATISSRVHTSSGREADEASVPLLITDGGQTMPGNGAGPEYKSLVPANEFREPLNNGSATKLAEEEQKRCGHPRKRLLS